jgi:hypothetical protein
MQYTKYEFLSFGKENKNIVQHNSIHVTLTYKVLYMHTDSSHLDDLRDIKDIMQKSSRFISLSGLSGVAAGICALIGAWYISTQIECWKRGDCKFNQLLVNGDLNMKSSLLQVAVVTFAAAFILAFLFTYIRSKKTNSPIWNFTARRLMINVAVPMIAGGILIYKMLVL